jgi:copper chaperone CopZ
MTVETFPVVGMTCGHCVSAVDSELRAVPGVTDVEISLVAGGTSQVTVTSEAPLTRDTVAAAVDEAGYALATSDVGAVPAPEGRGGLPLA